MYGPKGMKRSGFGAFTAAAKLAQQQASNTDGATGPTESAAPTVTIATPADAAPAPDASTNGTGKPAEQRHG